MCVCVCVCRIFMLRSIEGTRLVFWGMTSFSYKIVNIYIYIYLYIL
ncbi:hypothetical protein ACMBCN_00650 [Candidatus Liberibacter asiaticus]|nr:hypothetical protein [Candidatus Liberibacter asiaticus]